MIELGLVDIQNRAINFITRFCRVFRVLAFVEEKDIFTVVRSVQNRVEVGLALRPHHPFHWIRDVEATRTFVFICLLSSVLVCRSLNEVPEAHDRKLFAVHVIRCLLTLEFHIGQNVGVESRGNSSLRINLLVRLSSFHQALLVSIKALLLHLRSDDLIWAHHDLTIC